MTAELASFKAPDSTSVWSSLLPPPPPAAAAVTVRKRLFSAAVAGSRRSRDTERLAARTMLRLCVHARQRTRASARAPQFMMPFIFTAPFKFFALVGWA